MNCASRATAVCPISRVNSQKILMMIFDDITAQPRPYVFFLLLSAMCPFLHLIAIIHAATYKCSDRRGAEAFIKTSGTAFTE